MIDYQTINPFFGKGDYHVHGKVLPVQITGSYKSQSHEPATFTLWSDDEGSEEILDSSMRFPYGVWFEGKTEFDQPMWIMGIQPHQITGLKRLEGDAETFIIGEYQAIVTPRSTLSIHAAVSPTPLIIPEWTYIRRFDGTIEAFQADKKPRLGISWEGNHGKATLIDNYEFVDAKHTIHPVDARIQTNALFLEFTPTITSDVKTILDQLQKELADELTLLSFLGRWRVVCYEATAELDDHDVESTAFCRYKAWGGFHTLRTDQSWLRCLIKPLSLREGLFNRLLHAYRSSPHKAIVERSVSYLIASYEDGYVEAKLIQAFAALETMVDGLGEANSQTFLLRNNAFKRLAGKIKEVVEGEVKDQEVALGIEKKLPELNRRAIMERLLFLLDAHKVKTQLLWPPGTDEAGQLHELLKRRNLLIHTGAVSAGQIASFDLSRVQKLVELWILKLLDCPEDSINEYGLWQDAPINKFLYY